MGNVGRDGEAWRGLEGLVGTTELANPVGGRPHAWNVSEIQEGTSKSNTRGLKSTRPPMESGLGLIK